MLTQAQADELMALLKVLVKAGAIDFPAPGSGEGLEVKSDDVREAFVVDVNRRGKIKVTKCTYQERYQTIEVLLRLDIDGPPHTNPDGKELPCPHLHVYKEGFADKWAYLIPTASFTNTADLVHTLREFLLHCNVQHIPQIRGGLFDGHSL